MHSTETSEGWPDHADQFADLAVGEPSYMIIIGRGRTARKFLGKFVDDSDAIRWAYYWLGYRRASVARVYRGQRLRGEPLLEIRAPDRPEE